MRAELRVPAFESRAWKSRIAHERRLFSQLLSNLGFVIDRGWGHTPLRKRKGGNGPRRDQRLANEVAHKIMNKSGVPKAHLDLGRMNVNVYFGWRQLKENQGHGEHTGGQNIAIRFRNGVQDQPVTHQPAVHKEINAVPVQLLDFGTRHKTCCPDDRGFLRRLQPFLGPTLESRRVGHAALLGLHFDELRQ